MRSVIIRDDPTGNGARSDQNRPIGDDVRFPGSPGSDDHWMGLALIEASAATATGDVPVGAVVLDPDGRVVGTGRNAREATQDPTAHAEVLALRSAAAARGRWRLDGCTLVVTLEPCAMCAGALVLARVRRLVVGAWDPKAGAAGSMRDIVRDARLNHRVEVAGGVREQECSELLLTFFAGHREGGPEGGPEGLRGPDSA
jgi:tRNA(adenine34) deaminase